MIRREAGSGLGNSITFNALKDDETMMGYMALYLSITQNIDSSKALSKLGLKTYDKEANKRKAKELEKCITVENIITGEIKTFCGNKEAADFLKKGASTVSYYIRAKTLVDGLYKVTHKDCEISN